MLNSFSFQPEKDRRQKYLGSLLSDAGYQVILAENTPDLDIKAAELSERENAVFVLLPVPVSSTLLSQIKHRLNPAHIVLGGNLPKDFLAFCEEQQILTIDYMKFQSVAMKNAVATAEGAICQAITSSDINLHKSRCLVIGFGKCGEILAAKLQALGCQVWVSTRDELAKAKAFAYGYEEHDSYDNYDFIFNTAPALVITPSVIDKLKTDTVIIDIASKPGGCDFNYCIQKGITAKHCPGLPGKYAPKSSADIIYEEITKTLCL